MGLDSRSRYSKMVIRNSIFALLQEKPFHCISVTEVCKRAEINRTTFYKYYRDMPDWKEQIEQECLKHTAEILEDCSLTDMQAVLTRQFQEMQNHMNLYAVIFSPNFESRVWKSIVSMTLDRALSETGKHLPSGGAEDYSRKWDCYYAIYGCMGVMECWLRDGMKEAPEALAAYYARHVWQTLGHESPS